MQSVDVLAQPSDSEASSLVLIEALAGARIFYDAGMASVDDTFETCTWYRDHWTEDRIIIHTARG